MIAEGKVEFKAVPPPPLDKMIEMYERWYQELGETVSRMDEASWDRPAQLYNGGRLLMEQPTGEFLWLILFDAIHHRGQLSAYLRPLSSSSHCISRAVILRPSARSSGVASDRS